jgi:hypothetical protein
MRTQRWQEGQQQQEQQWQLPVAAATLQHRYLLQRVWLLQDLQATALQQERVMKTLPGQGRRCS